MSNDEDSQFSFVWIQEVAYENYMESFIFYFYQL